MLMARVLLEFPGETGDVMTQRARQAGFRWSRRTCSNPQADAVTAVLRALPWVWIVARPSLLGDLSQFHNLPKLPFSCLCGGGGDPYLAGGESKK